MELMYLIDAKFFCAGQIIEQTPVCNAIDTLKTRLEYNFRREIGRK